MKCKSDLGTVFTLRAQDLMKIFQKDEYSVRSLYQYSEQRDNAAKQYIRSALIAQQRIQNSLTKILQGEDSQKDRPNQKSEKKKEPAAVKTAQADQETSP